MDSFKVSIDGRCIISDDLGNILLDKHNKIHPMNMSRVFARALANENNHHIFRIAFGNGGTYIDATSNVVFNKPNVSNNYKNRLYNETYSEIIDDSSLSISTGLGASPSDDPLSSEHSKNGPGVVSNELSENSQVIITAVLNKNEPLSQYISQTSGNTIIDEPNNTVFSFDEIGVFTDGLLSELPTSASHSIIIDVANLYVNTGLSIDTDYDFKLKINGIEQYYNFRITKDDVPDGNITFLKFVNYLSKIVNDLATCFMKNGTSTTNINYNHLTFQSKAVGSNKSIEIVMEPENPKWLFNPTNIPSISGFTDPINGTDNRAIQNDPMNPSREYARLLSHLIFKPILKANDRIIIIKYIYDIKVFNV